MTTVMEDNLGIIAGISFGIAFFQVHNVILCQSEWWFKANLAVSSLVFEVSPVVPVS